MHIGAVADAAGVSAQTIRFYERRGLLPRPERAPNGYRHYDTSTLDRLEFIRSAQVAGLTLVEIGSILSLRRAGASPCTHVQSLLSTKLNEIQARRRELATLQTEIESLLTHSQQLDPADCTDTLICQIISTAT